MRGYKRFFRRFIRSFARIGRGRTKITTSTMMLTHEVARFISIIFQQPYSCEWLTLRNSWNRTYFRKRVRIESCRDWNALKHCRLKLEFSRSIWCENGLKLPWWRRCRRQRRKLNLRRRLFFECSFLRRNNIVLGWLIWWHWSILLVCKACWLVFYLP